MKHLSPWWKKKGATAVKRKWCHGNISVPIAHGDTGAKEVGVSVSCKDGGVLPDSGFPRYGGMAIEERAKTSLGHGANTSISYNTHAFVHGVVSGLYLRSMHSSGTRSSKEVVVHVS